ncbi:hypothetical protein ABRZ24_15750 [Brenneria populi]|uniref:PIN domain-containing protein n=1 Tax=Brenneria populi TaxID=1505588 RepID=A0ABU6JTS3_9GAMM|nr:hypothetical protein [Brenneria populi Li et al. 2015]
MVAKPLPSELVSLIHYVELNQSGWWKKATGQIIKGFLCDEPEPVSLEYVHDKINKTLGLYIPDDNFKDQINDLLSRHSIIKINNRFSLSETELQLLSKNRLKAKQEEIDTEIFFKKTLNESGLDIDYDSAWFFLKEELIKSIHNIGANTYKFLRDGSLRRDHDWLRSFLSKYPEKNHISLKRCISELLSPSNQSTKNYILRLLNAHFFVEATQLSKATIDSLDKVNKQREIKIILDTNFVFSVLGLHDNPSNESAESLLELPGKIGGLTIRYYVLRRTLEEIESVLSYQLERLKNFKFSPNLSVAVRRTGSINGIIAKFFEECEKNKETLSPEAYFLPYTKGLSILLDSKNIKILEWPTLHYPTQQSVIDDLIRIEEHQKNKPISERKRYEAILHDIIFWNAIQDNRDKIASSPLNENCWGVTLDWSLIRFDQVKRKYNKSNLPVVLHPTNFLQLIQFWIPRGEKLESGIMDSMRLPLFFSEFNAEDEQITLEIITKLSTYNNIKDIDVDTLSHILADTALKDKIKEGDKSNENIISIIESKFSDLANEYKKELDEKEQKIAEYKEIIESVKIEEKTSKQDVKDKKRQDNEIIRLKRENRHLKKRRELDKLKTRSKIERWKYIAIVLFHTLIPLILTWIIWHYLTPWISIKFNLDKANNLLLLGFLATVLVFSSIQSMKLIIKKNSSYEQCVLNKVLKSGYVNFISPIIGFFLAFKEQVIDILKGIN